MRKYSACFIMSFLIIFLSAGLSSADSISCRIYDEFKGHKAEIMDLAFSPNGGLLASRDLKGDIIVWNVEDGQQLRRIKGPRGEDGALSFAPDSRNLFASGENKAVAAWDVSSGNMIKEYKLGQPVTCIDISPDGRSLIAGGAKGAITVWDIRTGREIKSLKKVHKKKVLHVAFTGFETFRSVGEERSMKSWEISRSEAISTSVDEFDSELKVVSCDPAVSSWAFGTVVVRMKKGHSGIKEFHNIYLKDGVTLARTGTLKGHDLRIKALSFSPDGAYLASGGDGKTINIWNLESGQISADINFGAKLTALSFSQNGKWFAAGGESQLVTLYEIKGVSGQEEIPEAVMVAEPDRTPGEKYAVIIGVSKYKDSRICSLKYTGADARAFYDFLTKNAGFSRDKIKLILDQNASKMNIEDAFKNFLPRNAGRDDTVIIFFAGHGIPDTDLTGRADDGMEKYIVPYDADLDRVAASCYPMSEFSNVFSSLRSRRVIFFIDSCFSGGGAGSECLPDALKRTFSAKQQGFRGISITPNFINNLTKGPQGYGKVLITASQSNELALEIPELGHGLFTYYLLEALSGHADNGDGFITLKEVYNYLEERVAMRSRKAGGKQTPMMAGAITGKIVLRAIPGSE
jgi:WD40 repeat protein